MPDSMQNDSKQCWKRRTGLEKKLIAGTSILGLLALIFLIIIALRKSCPEEEAECTTQYCVEAAAELLEYIDLKQNPCDNFYRYTCGTYYKNAVKKDATSPWTTTQTSFTNEMKSLVVDQVKKKDTKAHIAMKHFYHTCMNETAIDEDDNGTFMDAIDQLGGWPMVNGTHWNAANFDWAQWYIKAKQMGLPVIGFFGLNKIGNKDSLVLRITGPVLDSGSQFSNSQFSKIMKGIAEAFDAPYDEDSSNELIKFIRELYKFRAGNEPDDTDIAEEDNEHDGDDDVEEERGIVLTTIKNLTEACPEVPWLKILNGVSGKHSQFHDSSKVAYYADNIEGYCKKLSKLLKETHPKVFANYYIWSIIYNAHIYMDKDIRRIFQDYADDDDVRFHICYFATEKRFKYLRETIYVRKKTSPEVRQQLQEMIDIMKELYVEHLKKCDWMDAITRTAAIEKAKKIESIIGAEDELYNIDEFDKILGVNGLEFTSNNMFKVMQQKMLKEDHHLFDSLNAPKPENWAEFFQQVVEVNAFFIPAANTMVIPGPILTSIFYNKKFPAFMNYGFMGSTVGHEFMHGFSKMAREVISENGTTIDWWTNATEKGYDKKVQCVIDEYEGIPFRYKLNGTLTLNENVADYVGADLGYEAYKRYIKKHGVEMKLPGVPLTPEQIYWVKTGTNYCFRKLDDNSVDYEEEDAHAIPSFRTQAPAKNSYYFAEAFNCPVGTPMNPKEKCQVL